MMIRMNLVLVGAALLAGFWTSAASAQAPALIPVQGVLTDDAGTPVDGDTTVQFSLYAGDLGGSPLYTETQSVAVAAGLFSIYLGDITVLDLSIFRDNSVWLGVSIDGGVELSPRVQFATTPYAAYAAFAGDAATVGGVGASGLVRSTVGAGISINASNEISVDRTQFNTWVTENVGAVSDTNTQNHARFTDAEAVTAVSAADTYVRNTGDTITGPFTVSSNMRVTGRLTAAGGIASQCNPGVLPTSTERVGSWCMTTRRRVGLRAGAIAACAAIGADLCSLSALLACRGSGAIGQCVQDTSPPTDPGRKTPGVLTSDYSPGTGVSQRSLVYFNRAGAAGGALDTVLVRDGNVNNVPPGGTVAGPFNYYCCSQALGI